MLLLELLCCLTTDVNPFKGSGVNWFYIGQHIFAKSFNFLVIWGLPVTVFHSTCIFCVYGMALYRLTLQFYVCMYVSFVCRYMSPPGECYYNTIMLQRLYFIVECGIACFLCVICVFEVRASSSSPRLPLCQISFLSQSPLLSLAMEKMTARLKITQCRKMGREMPLLRHCLLEKITSFFDDERKLARTFTRESRAEIVAEIKRIFNGNPIAIPQLLKLGQRCQTSNTNNTLIEWKFFRIKPQ